MKNPLTYFKTGAIRDTQAGKPDFFECLSPFALHRATQSTGRSLLLPVEFTEILHEYSRWHLKHEFGNDVIPREQFPYDVEARVLQLSLLFVSSFYSPFPQISIGLWKYGEYMMATRNKYPPDNWKKGIDKVSYLKSFARHMLKAQQAKLGNVIEPGIDHAEAMVFNIQGYIHEQEVERMRLRKDDVRESKT